MVTGRIFLVMNLSDIMLLARCHDRIRSGEARQLRVAAGLTQQQVGDHCGVTATAVAHWEAAARTPRGRPGLRYARLLDQLAARVGDEAVAS